VAHNNGNFDELTNIQSNTDFTHTNLHSNKETLKIQEISIVIYFHNYEIGLF